MASGISGYFELSGTNGITARIYYAETYNSATNTSTISISKLQVKSSSWYGVTYYPNGTISVDSAAVLSMDSVAGSHNVYISALNSYADVGAADGYSAAPWVSGDITHATDGSKSITISVDIKGYTTSGNYGSGWSVSGSKTIALTTIALASAISATDANIGATSMIAITKKDSNYTHSIAYTFGSLNGYITESGGVSASEVKFSGTSVSFAVPTDFYAQIPSAKTGTCTLTCKTYSGTTQIGDAQTCTFTATAAEASCKPTVSGTVVDSNETTKALTGDETKLVRYYSTALCTITAEAKNSASISSKTIGGAAVSGTTYNIDNIETGNIVFAATDSRGYTNNITVNSTMVAYIKLTCNPTAARTDPTSGNAKLTIKGNYFNGSFGAASNALTLKYRIGSGEYVAVTPTVSGNGYTASVDLSGLDYTQSYSVEVVSKDQLATVIKAVTVGQGIPVFDWGPNDMNINVPLKVEGHSVSVQTYTADGWIINTADGTIQAVGTATVSILPGGVARIDFAAKVTVAGTVTDLYDYGLNRNLLKQVNADIPTITPISGGVLEILNDDGTYNANLNGYGATFRARSQFWAPARVYSYSGSVGSVGIWSESVFAVGYILRGSCYGTVS